MNRVVSGKLCVQEEFIVAYYDGSDGRRHRQIHSEARGCRPQAYAAKRFSPTNAAEKSVDSQRLGPDDASGVAPNSRRLTRFSCDRPWDLGDHVATREAREPTRPTSAEAREPTRRGRARASGATGAG